MSNVNLEINELNAKIVLDKAIEQLSGLEVDVGFFTGENSEENGVDVATVAMFNELGTSNMPARPFMRNSVDNNVDEIKGFIDGELKKIIEGADASTAFKRLGIYQKDKIQQEIQEGDYAPNAPSTIRKKGSDRPLFDTGQMLQSVNYKVTKNGV